MHLRGLAEAVKRGVLQAGGFPREFYEAYGALDEGYARRKHVYNLYHLLNHLNLFGGGYRAQDWYISRMMSEPPTNSPLM